ncbi:hypothetical protein [Hyperthermus butylicus]|uniref:Uncharacterized protein n=1 Tax=Hyperthermus butylicus (strain DSM 5456 / JCM 9403 / PLM1-5) TaxID=415426 RepID=A2BK63_HYPBU|nr:hypothetical protein [Hyperthermus butylicus]ABM80374.1 hypothetical protein Hbut_0512 [Hyperthermus butylicus DSM 5456]
MQGFVAAIVSRGWLDPLLDIAREFYSKPVDYIVYAQRGREWWFTVSSSTLLRPEHVTVLASTSLGAFVASSCWASGIVSIYFKNGLPGLVHVCSLYKLSREALLTANPPEPSRRIPAGILMGLIARLVGDGASLERIAAIIAERLGGGASLVAALVYTARDRVAPVIVASSAGSKRICVSYNGGSAVISLGRDGPGTCLADTVVTLKPISGVARVEARSIEEVLYR